MTNTVSGKRVVRVRPDRLAAAARVAASPANSEVMVVDPTGQASVHAVEPGHPGVSARALFGKVPYEGYDEPAFVYQSTGAVSAEPKYSLVPLIWGTLKATVVAMLFAAPLAVLAAIYSSEFLHRRVRRYAKPSIELMASLPSVVLGFMAAMVVAPFVRDHLPKLMVLAATAPLAVVLAAHAWRMLSRERRAAIGAVAQFALIALVLAAGVAIAIPLAGPIEGLLFTPEQATATAQGLVESSGGSIRGWLNGDFGAAAPGWFVALLLPVVLILLIVDATALDPAWRRLIDRAPGRAANVVELARLLVNLALSVAIAAGLAFLLQALGFDPRNSIFGPFSQRNTLVVGMIMGIAVIPIIYTISEDAIRSVPDSLRSASLGVGATPWQTAVRVILPVAGSGIFSACMIGLGRAVGETMIVLMATGNTPEMSLNIFSGFRTLAANIAVELPEAPRASTHYRVLFLCGLVLFAMTLVINTTAELVRQHFRKRNASL
jgi:phosphate transport system permease protein